MERIELPRQTVRHNVVFNLPDAYIPELQRAERRINDLVIEEMRKLEQEKALLKQDMAVIRDYCHVSMAIMHEWYYDLSFKLRIALSLELRKYKATIKEQADHWQQVAESLNEENEQLRQELERHKGLVKDLRKAKKPERIINLVEKF